MLNDVLPPPKTPNTLDKRERVSGSDQKVPRPQSPKYRSGNMHMTTPSPEFALMCGSQTQPPSLTMPPKVLFSNIPPLEHTTQDTEVGEEGASRKRKKCDD